MRANLDVDVDERKNKPLMSQFGVEGIPHIAFLRLDGSPIGHFTGSVSPAQFTQILDKVKIDAKNPEATPAGLGTVRNGSGKK